MEYFRPIFVIDKKEAENIADPSESQISQSQPKRKSDSHLYRVNIQISDLQHAKIVRASSLDDEKHGSENPF